MARKTPSLRRQLGDNVEKTKRQQYIRFLIWFGAWVSAGWAFGAPLPPSGLLTDFIDDTQTVFRDGFAVTVPLEKAADSEQFAAIRTSKPTFSWIVNDSSNNVVQSAYSIELFAADFDEPCWSSGKIESDSSACVPYTGEPLAPDTVYRWRVQTENNGENNKDWSPWSMEKKFRTAPELAEFAVSSSPSIFRSQEPVSAERIDAKTLFYDFGQAAFARVVVTLALPDDLPNEATMTVRLGERVKEGRVDTKPAGSTRFAEYKITLEPGKQTYKIETRRDQRNSSGAAVLVPPYLGEVMPLRYAEIETPENVSVAKFVRYAAFYPFNESAASFSCNDERLNRVWEFCKYSIQATSFLGVYIDGDRERIPYEGDALLNQLSHYAVDREYSMARATQEYLIFHPTWPTEWILQSVQMAWYDYLWTGDTRLIAKYYDDLKAKSLQALAETNGLISTRRGKLTAEVLESVHFSQKLTGRPIEDIVDWPHKGLAGNENAESGETDGFVFNDYNAVVNAYYFFALHSMQRFAEALGKTDDADHFAEQIKQASAAYQTCFFDPPRGIYKDGESTDHASLHANMFALAFGLVPKEHQQSVADFIRSRGMKCSVYGAQFLLDAVYEAGDAPYGFERMTDETLRGWLNMMKAGSTISMEAWDDCYKPNQDWNHAWGAAPANIIPRRLVGVMPITPGCGKIRIFPQIEPLTEVTALVPTVRGGVGVVAQRDPAQGKYRLELSIPSNVVAEVRVPVRYGDGKLWIDGEPCKNISPDATNDGAFWTIPALGSGNRIVEVY